MLHKKSIDMKVLDYRQNHTNVLPVPVRDHTDLALKFFQFAMSLINVTFQFDSNGILEIAAFEWTRIRRSFVNVLYMVVQVFRIVKHFITYVALFRVAIMDIFRVNMKGCLSMKAFFAQFALKWLFTCMS